MLYNHHLFTEHNALILLLFWAIYSVIVVVYLNFLTRKYLTPMPRDEIVGDKKLKNYLELQETFANRESLNILVLSGGGLRGLVPLETLSYLEKRTGLKCGELFDFISGSSTGAISAAGFCVADSEGNYVFSAQNIIDTYIENAQKIFSSPWYHQLLTLFGLFAPRFLPGNKLEVLEGYYGNLTLGELKGNLLIPVYNIDQNYLQIVKNWSTPRRDSGENMLVKDLINGASSPPMLFPPVAFRLKNKDYLYIDPAVLLNNPILHVLLQVRSLFPNKHLNLVLIGNGGTSEARYNYRHMFSFGLYGLYQYLFSAPALGSKLYIDFVQDYLDEAGRVDPNITFFRVNAEPNEKLSASDASLDNLTKIQHFGNRMLQVNLVIINKIAACLIKSHDVKVE